MSRAAEQPAAAAAAARTAAAAAGAPDVRAQVVGVHVGVKDEVQAVACAPTNSSANQQNNQVWRAHGLGGSKAGSGSGARAPSIPRSGPQDAASLQQACCPPCRPLTVLQVQAVQPHAVLAPQRLVCGADSKACRDQQLASGRACQQVCPAASRGRSRAQLTQPPARPPATHHRGSAARRRWAAPQCPPTGRSSAAPAPPARCPAAGHGGRRIARERPMARARRAALV